MRNIVVRVRVDTVRSCVCVFNVKGFKNIFSTIAKLQYKAIHSSCFILYQGVVCSVPRSFASESSEVDSSDAPPIVT